MNKFIGFKFGNDFEVGLGKTYEGFIINEDGFSYSLGPDFDDEFASTSHGNRTYYLGTTIGNKNFNFDVQFKELNINQFREIMYKLRPKKVGLLEFDQWPDFAFNVKLESVGEAVYDPIPNCDSGGEPREPKYNIRVGLSFVTVDRWWAEKVEGDEPVSNVGSIDNTNYRMENYLVIEFTGELTVNGHKFGEPASPIKGTFYSEYGIAIGDNGEFIGSIPEARIEIPPGETKTDVKINVSEGGNCTVKKTTRNHM